MKKTEKGEKAEEDEDLGGTHGCSTAVDPPPHLSMFLCLWGGIKSIIRKPLSFEYVVFLCLLITFAHTLRVNVVPIGLQEDTITSYVHEYYCCSCDTLIRSRLLSRFAIHL